MKLSQLPILLTASISTRGMKGACFSDVEREKMYLSTLAFYLKKMPEYKFVFAENSGWNLENFKSKLPSSILSADNMEFISVSPLCCDLSKGKGYNELILIYNAISQSKFINDTGAFFKVTGRYPIYNLHKFVLKAESAFKNGNELYCDIKDHKLYDWLHLGWCGHSFDCRLFGCTTFFFLKYFWPNTNKCNDYEGLYLEEVLFNATKLSNEKQIVRFHREPHLGGVAGHMSNAVAFSQNHDDLKSNLKRFVGNCIRIFTPWFKF